MKKIAMFALMIAVIAVSGCILGGGDVQSSPKTGLGLEITEFMASPVEVQSGKLATLTMSIENQGDYKVSKDYGFVYLITGSDWKLTGEVSPEVKAYSKDLKSEDTTSGQLAGTAMYRWSAQAPLIPSGQERTDTFIARAYYDYQTKALGNVWIYPEVEATAARDKSASLSKSTFTYTEGPITLAASIIPDPVIVAADGELFSLQIDLKNVGNGVVYKNKTITTADTTIGETDLNKVDLVIDFPTGITIVDPSCYTDVELIGGESSVICDLKVATVPTTKKTVPLTIKADYGYYTEDSISVKILGK